MGSDLLPSFWKMGRAFFVVRCSSRSLFCDARLFDCRLQIFDDHRSEVDGRMAHFCHYRVCVIHCFVRWTMDFDGRIRVVTWSMGIAWSFVPTLSVRSRFSLIIWGFRFGTFAFPVLLHPQGWEGSCVRFWSIPALRLYLYILLHFLRMRPCRLMIAHNSAAYAELSGDIMDFADHQCL